MEQSLQFISIWSVIIPLITGGLFFKRLNRRIRIIWYVSLFAALPQMVRFFVSDYSIRAFYYNLYSVVDFVLMQAIFYSFFTKRNEKIFSYISSLLFSIYYLFLITTYGINKRFINEIVCLDNLLYTISALMILYEEIDQEHTIIDFNVPDFYFLLAILLYAPITVFIFSTWHYIQNNNSTFVTIAKSINSLSNTTLYIFYAIAIYKSCNKSKLAEI